MKYAIILALAMVNSLSFAAGSTENSVTGETESEIGIISGWAAGALENPVAGGTESGIGVISGWHCTAKEITASIDSESFGKAGVGTGRGDAASICGRFDTGYSLLINYNQFTPGNHTLNLFCSERIRKRCGYPFQEGHVLALFPALQALHST